MLSIIDIIRSLGENFGKIFFKKFQSHDMTQLHHYFALPRIKITKVPV